MKTVIGLMIFFNHERLIENCVCGFFFTMNISVDVVKTITIQILFKFEMKIHLLPKPQTIWYVKIKLSTAVTDEYF